MLQPCLDRVFVFIFLVVIGFFSLILLGSLPGVIVVVVLVVDDCWVLGIIRVKRLLIYLIPKVTFLLVFVFRDRLRVILVTPSLESTSPGRDVGTAGAGLVLVAVLPTTVPEEAFGEIRPVLRCVYLAVVVRPEVSVFVGFKFTYGQPVGSASHLCCAGGHRRAFVKSARSAVVLALDEKLPAFRADEKIHVIRFPLGAVEGALALALLELVDQR